MGEEIVSLWEEYEAGETAEARSGPYYYLLAPFYFISHSAPTPHGMQYTCSILHLSCYASRCHETERLGLSLLPTVSDYVLSTSPAVSCYDSRYKYLLVQLVYADTVLGTDGRVWADGRVWGYGRLMKDMDKFEMIVQAEV